MYDEHTRDFVLQDFLVKYLLSFCDFVYIKKVKDYIFC